jgi:hypothetical protein
LIVLLLLLLKGLGEKRVRLFMKMLCLHLLCAVVYAFLGGGERGGAACGFEGFVCAHPPPLQRICLSHLVVKPNAYTAIDPGT